MFCSSKLKKSAPCVLPAKLQRQARRYKTPSMGGRMGNFAPKGGGEVWPFGPIPASFLKYFETKTVPKGGEGATAPLAPPPYLRPCTEVAVTP